MRLFGLADWVIERFTVNRRRLYDLQYEATRLREKSVLGCLVIVLGANLVVFWSLGDRAADGRLSLASAIVALQAAIGVSAIAFGGLNWALDGAAAPAAAVARLEAVMPPAGALEPGPIAAASGGSRPGDPLARRQLRLPRRTAGARRARPDDPRRPVAGDRRPERGGQDDPGQVAVPALRPCRRGRSRSTAIDLRRLDLDGWRDRVTAVFQDFVRFELPLRENVAPGGGSDDVVQAALAGAGAHDLCGLDTVLAKGYPGGTDLSGGQWQRVALARALCAVRAGAGVVLLDEPTAQLDVRGEAEIFGRILDATRGRTTILISHRFSTVRQADLICVLEHGAVVEVGTHDELMARGGRYRTMFDLQASRFVELDESGEEVVYESLD